MAIGLALFFRKVALALLAGLFVGALLISQYNLLDTIPYLVFDVIWVALIDSGHVRILTFAFLLGSLIKVISRSGGSMGMAQAFTRFATTQQKCQLTSWGLGIAFFFDDYANTLLVGSGMRPIFDKLRISREKLAFIVDATAAPVASLAPISTWIIVEVGYISDQCNTLSIHQDAYSIFLQTIPYRFYPLLMLVFGLIIALTGRDFGPMARAEQDAFSAKEPPSSDDLVDTDITESSTPRGNWKMAAIPILVVILSLIFGLLYSGYKGLEEARGQIAAKQKIALTELAEAERAADINAKVIATRKLSGYEEKLGQLTNTPFNILGYASSSTALLFAALLGGLLAVFMAVRNKKLKLRDALMTWIRGGLSMAPVIVILLFAWSLGIICQKLETASFLVSILGSGFDAGLLPAIIFIVAAVVSFATGTSWGTMGLIFPLAVPLSHQLSPGNEVIFLGSIAAILSGSVFGDHCSPISDTTIMSAMASSCDQIAHVRTQLPYALVVAVFSILIGSLPNGLEFYSPWIGLLLGSTILTLFVRFVGKRVT